MDGLHVLAGTYTYIPFRHAENPTTKAEVPLAPFSAVGLTTFAVTN